MARVTFHKLTPGIEGELEDIDDVVERDERDPRRRAYLERARKQIAERLPQETRGIANLRLKSGWSQRRLAQEIGTTQPHVARMEAGQDVMLDTARRLAAALGVSLLDIDAALRASRRQKARRPGAGPR